MTGVITYFKTYNVKRNLGGIMVTIYFSGTGNSEFLAKKFSEKMNCKCFSIEERVDFNRIIKENDTIALCYPIHFSKAPVFFMDFVSKHKEVFRGKKVIVLCSQQFYSGDGARSIFDLLEDVEVLYTEHFNMQNNITAWPSYYMLTKRNNKRCLSGVEKKTEKIARDIKEGKVKLKGFSEFSKFLGRGQHISPERIKEKQSKAVRVNESCVLCGKCVKHCPTKNLKLERGQVTDIGECNFCMRCVNLCPKKSITVMIHGKVREQYIIGDFK